MHDINMPVCLLLALVVSSNHSPLRHWFSRIRVIIHRVIIEPTHTSPKRQYYKATLDGEVIVSKSVIQSSPHVVP